MICCLLQPIIFIQYPQGHYVQMCKYMHVVLAIVHQGFENNYTLSDGHESITSHNLIVFVVAVVCTTTFYY